MIKRKDGFSGERALVLPASIIHTMENNPLANALHITDIGYYPRVSAAKLVTVRLRTIAIASRTDRNLRIVFSSSIFSLRFFSVRSS